MEVSMSITRRGKYTNSNICINVQVRNVVCLFFLLYANLLVLVTLCEGNHYPFIEERYEKKYLRQNLPPATIIIYDLLIKMNVYVSIQR